MTSRAGSLWALHSFGRERASASRRGARRWRRMVGVATRRALGHCPQQLENNALGHKQGLTVLWMQFATTLRYCMSWLSGRYWLGAGFGLFGAPLAFYAGDRLGAIEFLSPRPLHFAVLGCVWSTVVPLLVYTSDRLASRNAPPPKYRWLDRSISEC